MTNLIAVVFFYYGYHPEDGRVTDSNMLKTLQQKYIIQLKCICWLLIYFIHLINARKVSQVFFNYNPLGSRITRRPKKTDGGILYR